MGSEKSSKSSQAAAGTGVEKVPTNSMFEGANSTPGDVFGDKSPRNPPEDGADLAMGLSECVPFNGEDPADLGMGRNDSNGKPMGPQMGPVNNGGAGAKLRFG